MSVRQSKSHRSRRASGKVKIRERLAQTYRHVPFRTRVAVAGALTTLCCIVILGASLELGFRAWQPIATAEPVAASFWPPPSILLPTGHPRALYPYSVIPGGAQSPRELKEAAAMDPVVAQHYADFDIANARRVTLDAPKLVYVSYRIGNKVFWTKNKLALRKGEAMLSDGQNMARTRCGNRISVLPVRPNAPAEPSSSELDGPEFAPIVSTPYLAAYTAPMPGGPFQSPGGPGASFVPVAPFFPLPGGGGIGGSRNSTTPPPGGGGGTPGGGGGNTPSPGGGNGGGGTPGGGGGTPGGGGGTPPPGGGSGGGGTPGGGGGGTPLPGGGGGTPGGGGGTPPPVGVPEPGTGALVLIGLGAAGMRARRKRKAC